MDPEITYVPSFVERHDDLFLRLRAETKWDTRMRSRLTASFGVAYNYSQLSYADAPFPELVSELKARIETRVGHAFTNCLANFYEDGSRTMGWHSDSEPEIRRGSTIAVLSLGAARVFELRLKDELETILALRLEPGSLLLMEQSVQDLWQHRLPRASEAGAHMSLTFREIVSAG